MTFTPSDRRRQSNRIKSPNKGQHIFFFFIEFRFKLVTVLHVTKMHFVSSCSIFLLVIRYCMDIYMLYCDCMWTTPSSRILFILNFSIMFDQEIRRCWTMLSGLRALTPPAFSLVLSWQGIKPSHLDVSIKHKVMPLTHMLVCFENVCVWGGWGGSGSVDCKLCR